MKKRTLIAGLVTAGFALGLLVMPAPALAQMGGAAGKVVDEAGKPVEGADVTISNPSGVGTTKLKTNAKGDYQAIGIPPTDYQVVAVKGNLDRKSTRLNSSHVSESRMPSSA